ncbi:gamma-glutamyltransferase [Mesorhizobium sp. M1295]|uniref:gamma-glutamyltransferase n=1 Tax=Mesorhizobium sp. M1295 TaxID=2957076 RepID=UPI00333961AC
MLGWCEALRRFGPFFLADVTEPAIRDASRGFRMTPYQQVCVSESAADLARWGNRQTVSAGAVRIQSGTRLVTAIVPRRCDRFRVRGRMSCMAADWDVALLSTWVLEEGFLTLQDRTGYRTTDCVPLRGYIAATRGSDRHRHRRAAAYHQMLNGGYDIGALGFATPDTLHLQAEVLKIAFADRAAASADVPVGKLLSKGYAAERRITMDRT